MGGASYPAIGGHSIRLNSGRIHSEEDTTK